MLDDEQVARYARQIVVPGIGAAGQEKLLQSTVLVVGHPRGCATASLYLRAAGVNVAADSPHPQAVIVAGASGMDEDTLAWATAKNAPVCWYDADEDGFTSGVHPEVPLPRSSSRKDVAESSAVHDAGACAAASNACSVILGMGTGSTIVRIAM